MTFENPGMPDMLASLRAALDSPEPIDFLTVTSSMISVVDPVPTASDPFQDEEEDTSAMSLTWLLRQLLSTPTEETDCVLVACAEILGDPNLQTIVDLVVKPRLKVMPAWLAELPRMRVKRAMVFGSMLGGEETIALEVRGPRGGFTLMVSVARQGTPFLENVYPVLGTIDEVAQDLEHGALEGGGLAALTAKELDLKDARARIEEAVEMADMMVPPIETETWPAFRPLLEWQVDEMPEGGEGYVFEEWSEEQIDALANDFAASPHASSLSPDESGLATLFIDLALNYGTGNPLQWNPIFIEQFLLDLVPRKVLYPDEDLHAIPRVLSSFTAYANEAMGVPDSIASDVQEIIEELTPLYLDAIDPKTREAAQPWHPDLLDALSRSFPLEPLVRLADIVGGEEVLENLDANPLPVDEPLDLGNVPEGVRGPVQKVADLVNTHAPQFFDDPEMPTAAQRTLLLIAEENPEAFARRSKDLNTAAAILFIAGHNNRWFTQGSRDRTATALAKVVGVSPVSWDRAFNMTKGLRTPETLEGAPHTFALGRPELLTSTRRKNIIEEKTDLEELAKDLAEDFERGW